MSVIKLKCIDQVLTIVNSPDISSGNVNYDTVNFEFCNAWSGFTKTAIFYRSKDEVYYQVLDSDNNCIIPKEVLKEKGLIYIGVFGNKDDLTLTSQVVAYRISEGAITEGLTPSDPTPDIYAQILAEFGDVRDVYEEFKETCNEFVETLEESDNTVMITTNDTLSDSKAGGLKIDHIIGSSVQDGEPTPDTPIAIQNVGDCVEMIQGGYSYTNGAYSNTTTICCSKNSIPCKSGDSIVLKTEEATSMYVLYYNNGTFVSYANISSATELSATVPSGANSFHIRIDTPIDTVGKITLTINDKYVLQVKTVWKNLLGNIATSKTTNGVTFTVNEDKSISISGTSTASAQITIGNLSLSAGSYAFSGMTNSNTDKAYINFSGITNVYDGEVEKTLSTNTETTCSLIVKSGYTFNETIYPMVREVGTNDTYAPYTEKVATILLNEPLRQDDVLYKDNGAWYVERNRASVTYDKVTDTLYQKTINGFARCFLTLPNGVLMKANTVVSNMFSFQNANSTLYHEPSAEYGFYNASATLGRIAMTINEEFTATSDFNAWLETNAPIFEYELATPTIEELDADSQIALNNLKTFDTVTHIEVNSVVQPSEVKVEFGITRASSLALEASNNADNALVISKNTVSKDNVVNNLTTTEEGFVLDARQGKNLMDLLTGAIKISSISGSQGNGGTVGSSYTRYLYPSPTNGYRIVGVVGFDVDKNSGATVNQAFYNGSKITIGFIQTIEADTTSSETMTYTVYYLEVKKDLIG